MKKRLTLYTLHEKIIQEILNSMHKNEQAKLTILKRDYRNEYDVAEERLTNNLPDELERKIKFDYLPFPYTRDDCERFKFMIALWGRDNNRKIAVTFNPTTGYRQRMPSLVITLSNICRAVGAGLPGGSILFEPDDNNTPFAGGYGPMTKLESTYVSSGRLPGPWCQWVRKMTNIVVSNEYYVEQCNNTKTAVIKAMREYNKRTKNKVRLVRATWWTPERTTHIPLDFPERMRPIERWQQGLELHYEICKPVPALQKLVENRFKM